MNFQNLNDILLLLQAGNKKAKQARDFSQKVFNFINGYDYLTVDELTSMGFRWLLCEKEYSCKSLEKFCWIKANTTRFSIINFDKFVSKIRDKAKKNQEQMQDFYALKSQIVMVICEPVLVHKSNYFKTKVYDDDYYKYHDYFVLFRYGDFTFHVPYDDVVEKISDEILEKLPHEDGFSQVSADLADTHPYAHLTLVQITKALKKAYKPI